MIQYNSLTARARIAVVALTAAVLVLGAARPACAATGNDFTVKALIPDNQLDRKKSYFDLRMEPGQSQTVQLQISNPGKDPVTVTAALNAAATGQDGVVVYTEPDIRDESMLLSITDVAQVRDSVLTVPAGGSALVNIDLSMPERLFDGVVLGGINVAARLEQTEQQPVDQGVSLNNEYVYVVGLRLTQTDAHVAPELHYKGVEPGLVNYHTALTIRLQNSEPVLMKNMRILARVYREGSQAVHLEELFEPAEMAPNSTGEFVMSWGDALQSGGYRLYLRAEHGERVWEWDEMFRIGPELANESNSGAVNIVSGGTLQRMLKYLPHFILLIGGIFLWIYYRRREQDSERRAL